MADSPYVMEALNKSKLNKRNIESNLITELFLEYERSAPYSTENGDNACVIHRYVYSGDTVPAQNITDASTSVENILLKRTDVYSLCTPENKKNTDVEVLKSLSFLRLGLNISIESKERIDTPIVAVMKIKTEKRSLFKNVVRFESMHYSKITLNANMKDTNNSFEVIAALDDSNDMAYFQIVTNSRIHECIAIFNARFKIECETAPNYKSLCPRDPLDSYKLEYKDDADKYQKLITILVDTNAFETWRSQRKTKMETLLNTNIFLDSSNSQFSTDWHETLYFFACKMPCQRYTINDQGADNSQKLPFMMKHLSSLLYDTSRLHYTHGCLLAVASVLLIESDLVQYETTSYPEFPREHFKHTLLKLGAWIDKNYDLNVAQNWKLLKLDIMLQIAKTADLVSFLYSRLMIKKYNERAGINEDIRKQFARLLGQGINSVYIQPENLTIEAFGHILAVHFFSSADNILQHKKLQSSSSMLKGRELTAYTELERVHHDSKYTPSGIAHHITFTLKHKFHDMLKLESLMNPDGTSEYSWMRTYNLYNAVPDPKFANVDEQKKHWILVNFKSSERYRFTFTEFLKPGNPAKSHNNGARSKGKKAKTRLTRRRGKVTRM